MLDSSLESSFAAAAAAHPRVVLHARPLVVAEVTDDAQMLHRLGPVAVRDADHDIDVAGNITPSFPPLKVKGLSVTALTTRADGDVPGLFDAAHQCALSRTGNLALPTGTCRVSTVGALRRGGLRVFVTDAWVASADGTPAVVHAVVCPAAAMGSNAFLDAAVAAFSQACGADLHLRGPASYVPSDDSGSDSEEVDHARAALPAAEDGDDDGADTRWAGIVPTASPDDAVTAAA